MSAKYYSSLKNKSKKSDDKSDNIDEFMNLFESRSEQRRRNQYSSNLQKYRDYQKKKEKESPTSKIDINNSTEDLNIN